MADPEIERVQTLGHALDALLKTDERAVQSRLLNPLCMSMGYQLTPKEEEESLKELDPNGTGAIPGNTFIKWWKEDGRFKSLQLKEGELKNVIKCVSYFQFFDHFGKGVLDVDEFEALHDDLSKRSLISCPYDDTVKDVAVNGEVHFGRYVQWLVSNNAVVLTLSKSVLFDADDKSFSDDEFSDDEDDDDDSDDDIYDESDEEEEEEKEQSEEGSSKTEGESEKKDRRFSLKATAAHQIMEAKRTSRGSKIVDKIGEQQSSSPLASSSSPAPPPETPASTASDAAQETKQGDERKGKPEVDRHKSVVFPQNESVAHMTGGSQKKEPNFAPGKCKHTLKWYHFSSPAWCGCCGKFLWGLGKQGYLCLTCDGAFHGGDCLGAVVELKDKVLKSGHLMKIGSAKKDSGTGKWQKRFFVLTEAYVFYFKKSNKKELLGCFPVNKRLKFEEDVAVEHGILVTSKERTFHLKALSKSDQESWLHFLGKSLKK